MQLEMVERAKLAEPERTYTAPPNVALQPEMVESVTMRSLFHVYVAPPYCAVARRERGEAAVAPLDLSPCCAVRRCRSAASSTRRTLAEQPDTSELVIETAPLYSA